MAGGGMLIGMYWASRAYDVRITRDRQASVPIAPVFRRPIEFGPLMRPWEDIERMRVAILADQLAFGEGGAAHERVLYWLSHWDDHVLSLTGRGVPA
jgi:hypothetical protein